ncbi:YbbR-like domain-containing protein [Streptococcus sp. zg-JUN1979]|uniref:CdaR family protein n=1 Tax=Streptococcus sp. zg-JUN1979 TaxID=3391450 RepID=UPI0039A6F9B5
MKKRHKNKTNTIGLMAVSIFLALLLFLTATINTNSKTGTQVAGATETYTHTLTNVPIDLKYDSDKYFVSGYSYEVRVYLSSVNRVKLDSEINSDTRQFKVVADLSHEETGTRTVRLKVTNLPSDVTATIEPKTISVTIGQKESKTFEVQGVVAASQVAVGYEVTDVSTNLDTVKVTSDESIIQRIDHVEAALPEDEVLDGNYSGKVNLQAVASDGTVLAGIIAPSKARLDVTVKKLTKEVPVKINLVGEMDESLSKIDYKLSQNTVTISGTREALDAISEVEADVDISNITKDTTKTITLSADDVVVTPAQLSVQLTTTKK